MLTFLNGDWQPDEPAAAAAVAAATDVPITAFGAVTVVVNLGATDKYGRRDVGTAEWYKQIFLVRQIAKEYSII